MFSLTLCNARVINQYFIVFIVGRIILYKTTQRSNDGGLSVETNCLTSCLYACQSLSSAANIIIVITMCESM